MLAMPAPTRFDLRFRLLDVPVRVHPGFWLVGLILGYNAGPRGALIWAAILFVSILVHEMGHALASKWLRLRPEVLLYWMGGLCFSERQRRGLGGRVFILAAGPGAGLLLAVVTAAVAYAAHGMTIADDLALFGVFDDPERVVVAAEKLGYRTHPGRAEVLWDIYTGMFFINVLWSLVNLLPIWFLDGGQISAEVLSSRMGAEGMRRAHGLSILVAGALAIWQATERDLFLTAFFGMFAFLNYRQMQGLPPGGRGFGGDSADWWKR